MRQTIVEKCMMAVYRVPEGRGYAYAATNGGYGYLAVAVGEKNPYSDEEYEGPCSPADACVGTFDGEWKGGDDGWGECTFSCEIGTWHA